MEDELLFVDEVAALLKRSPAALRYQMSKGRAPKHAMIAGRIAFRRSDVNAYIEAAFAEAS